MILRGEQSTRRVWINGKELDPRPSQKLFNHSPDGFNWGYGGSGPAQLALAILLDRFGKEKALRFYQDLKSLVIACLHGDFEIELDLINWIHTRDREHFFK